MIKPGNDDSPCCCVICVAVSGRLVPGMAVEKIADKFKVDRDFAAEWLRAQQAILMEQQEEGVLPTFLPAADCSRSVAYGYMIYEKAALLHETHVVQIFNKTPRQLQIPVWRGHFDSPSGPMKEPWPCLQETVFQFSIQANK